MKPNMQEIAEILRRALNVQIDAIDAIVNDDEIIISSNIGNPHQLGTLRFETDKRLIFEAQGDDVGDNFNFIIVKERERVGHALMLFCFENNIDLIIGIIPLQ